MPLKNETFYEPMRFYVSRHVSGSSPDHVISLASRCLESIRAVYPDSHVTFVEDRVDPKLSFSTEDARVRVVTNPFPGSGELGTVYTAARSENRETGDVNMIIMHDSMVLLGPVNETPGPFGVRALWDFRRYHFHHMPEVLTLLSAMVNSGGPSVFQKRYAQVLELLSLYTRPPGTWSGCFGIGLLATRQGLERLGETFGVLDEAVLRVVDTREKRQAMERVFGMALSTLKLPAPPVCGEIFSHPDPWSTDSARMTLAEFKDFARSKSYWKPLGKTWVGR